MNFKAYSNKTWVYCVVAMCLYVIAIVNSNIVVGGVIAGAVVFAILFARNAAVEYYKATADTKT